jgi:hypothetical protein
LTDQGILQENALQMPISLILVKPLRADHERHFLERYPSQKSIL